MIIKAWGYGGNYMIFICKNCIHNCGNPPISNKKPNAICWCNAEYGRAITKKYKECKNYKEKE